jgi:hypothetical protein
MQTFDLVGEEAVLRLQAASRPATGYFAWKYQARLQGHALQVDIPVEDDDPASFAAFFESLAEDAPGWSGARGYESLDGILGISATHDGAGGVRFEVRLRGNAGSGFDWSAAHRLSVQATQLAGIAASARAFAG